MEHSPGKVIKKMLKLYTLLQKKTAFKNMY